ncbi:hypothetical protein TGAMA5MH_03811 [Trichoderma gamsii]|uniref:Uncharacterized protein n=1 Tax=Trichoderma gamsii TaxID=398673 RepID=A0A2K0TG14_9HYPO|nr:hypothetical protein TGAMA5MH_03811 [Trichoderma gamsii]
MLTPPPRPFLAQASLQGGISRIKIQYVSDHVKRLQPVPLPPPVILYSPLSADSSSSGNFGYDGDDELHSSEDTALKALGLQQQLS